MVLRRVFRRFVSHSAYVQGQLIDESVREYFYYLDHQGQLFLDDVKSKNFITCFKDQQFLSFFFRMLKKNKYERYDEHFPFVSLCGKERNFLRCDDVPIVFTHIKCGDTILENLNDLEPSSDFYLIPNNIIKQNLLNVPFNPAGLCMLPNSGRLYHPSSERHGGVGLIKSSLAIELSNRFIYDSSQPEIEVDPGKGPIAFDWFGERIRLNNRILDKIKETDES
ncbi:UPF0598 protein C8orf82 homolog [Symsagittifera roscoffensis]|uniref:UPF0598 protein C8orf82 homolog n=1 Tax=Symsagittifera roscoffensis TaxID=84072 RepID=UPI00307C401B